jgi:hypothetical protein
VRAQVARQIDELVGREVGGGDALEDLLVGGVGRLGRAPVIYIIRDFQKPRITSIVVFSRRSEGGQLTPSSARLTVAAVARACGLSDEVRGGKKAPRKGKSQQAEHKHLTHLAFSHGL